MKQKVHSRLWPRGVPSTPTPLFHVVSIRNEVLREFLVFNLLAQDVIQFDFRSHMLTVYVLPDIGAPLSHPVVDSLPPGDHTVVVSVTDTRGGTDAVSFDFTISEPIGTCNTCEKIVCGIFC